MRGINIVAKKESSTKSFVLRVDAETMDAIEKWAADEFFPSLHSALDIVNYKS